MDKNIRIKIFQILGLMLFPILTYSAEPWFLLPSNMETSLLDQAYEDSRLFSKGEISQILKFLESEYHQSAERPVLLIIDSHKIKNFEKFTVMGLSEQDVLNMIGDEHGWTCSDLHDQGDMGNRWCHASIVKVVDRSIRSMGVNKFISAAIGAAVFLPKEYLIDQHPSMSDLVFADVPLVESEKGSFEVSTYFDGATFFVFRRKF